MTTENEYDLMLRQDIVDKPLASRAQVRHVENEFDAMFKQELEQQKLRATMVPATQQNPDEYAEAKKLGRATGIPAQVVARNLDQVRQRAQLNEFDEMFKTSPATARALSNPDTARLAHDDGLNMSVVEKLTGSFKRGLKGSLRGADAQSVVESAEILNVIDRIERGELQDDVALAAQTKYGSIFAGAGRSPENLARMRAATELRLAENAIEYTQRGVELKQMPTSSDLAAFQKASGLRDTFSKLADAPLSIAGQVSAESTGALLPYIPAVVGAGAAGGVRGLAATTGAASGSVEYAVAVSEILTKLGVDVNDHRAVQAAVRTPEFAALNQQALIKAGIIGAVDAATAGMMGTRLVRNAAGNLVAQTGVQMAGGAVGEIAGSVASGQEVNPAAVLSEMIGEGPTAIIDAATLGGRRAVQKASEAREAQHNAKVLADVTKAAKESKLRARDPEAFEKFVDTAAEYAPVQEVYISTDALEQSGVDIQQLAAVSPAIAAQLPEVMAAGGDIAITLAEYTTQVAATDFAQALVPHLRTAPDALSQAEAEVYLQGDPADEVRREVEALAPTLPETKPSSSSSIVREQVLQQLTQANRFTPDVNATYADLTAGFYTAMADRMGVTPEALAEQIPLNVVSSLAVNLATSFNTQTAQPEAGGPSPAIPHQAASSLPALPNALEQSTTLDQEQGGRRGAYDVPTRTIALLDKADLSTFLHESGHFYLEALNELAARPEAPADVQADVQAVMQWFGVSDLAQWKGMTLEAKRPFHEKFARGFEAYTFEGNAPSIELQSVFARFRSWLMRVYQNIKNLNVELTPEVRGVFDRMLATKSEIATAEAVRGFAPLFKSAESAGMTPEQFAEYQRIGRDATNDATAQLERRSLRDMAWQSRLKARTMRELNAEANEKRQAIKAEVSVEVMADPLQRARHILARGEDPLGEPLPGGPIKLDIAALEERYGGNGDPYALLDWKKLTDGGPYRVAAKQGGIHPDAAAELFGFSSGDELVRKLLDTEPAKDVIEARTDQRMLERYGDLSSPDAVERAAEAAIHNDVRGRFIERELNALAKATGNRPVLARAARAFAEQTMAQKRIRDIRPSQYVAAESKAARNADAAFKKADLQRAAAEKRNQLLNHQLGRVAIESSAEAVKLTNYLRKFNSTGTRAAIGAEYIDQIDQQLEHLDLRKSVTNKAADKRKSLAQWIEAQREMGFEPVIDERLLADANRKPARELTLEELRGVADTVKNIEHLGRLKNKLLTAQDERAFDAAAQDMIESIVANGGEVKPVQIEQGPIDKTLASIANVFGMHRKIASLARELDGVKDDGAVTERIVRPMNAAGDKEAVMREQATIALGKLFEQLKGSKLREKLFIPAINTSLSREARIAVALNTGNAANLQRLQDGDGWSGEQVSAIVATLSPKEKEFVQSVWTYLDGFWPEIAAKEERTTGLAPEKVEGSYYPIKFDSNRSSRSEADNMAELVKQSMQGLYTRATTRRGHTKARVEEVTGRPVRKDLGVIFEHVTQVTHDLAWHEYLIDANRLLRHKGVDAAIRNHHGPEVLRQMRNTLEALAVGDVPAQNAFERFTNHIRTGATIAGLGWNLMTAALQPFGLTQSMVRIGPKWVGRGIAQWVGDAARMENTAQMIYGKSDMMRLRSKTMQREINEIRNTVSGQSQARTVLHQSYFYFIQKMQLVADIPTWLGQYEKALSTGNDEASAIAQADQAVLGSQGGGQIKDLAAIQRGGPYLKLFTNFYSFFNTTFNLTAESYSRTHFKNPIEAGRFAVDMMLLYVLPSVLVTLMRAALKGEDLDDEELAKKLVAEQLSYMLGTMVGLRELSATVSAVSGLPASYSGPAGVRFFGEMVKLGKQVGDGEVDEGMIDAANAVGGVLFHYPSGQLERTLRGLEAVSQGDAGSSAILFGPPRN